MAANMGNSTLSQLL